MYLSIIFPVLDERLRLENGIRRTVAFLEQIKFDDYEILIVDNGSKDETPQIANALCKEYSRIHYFGLSKKGVGIAFRKGIEEAKGDIVGYMDIDLSTDIKHLGEAITIFKTKSSVQYINGSRFANESNTKGRKWYRKITSQGLIILLKFILRMKSTDALCGFTFLRKETAAEMVDRCSDENGWFYVIEFLLRAERNNVRILDYPIEWIDDYNTTVKVFALMINYMRNIVRLYFRLKKDNKQDGN